MEASRVNFGVNPDFEALHHFRKKKAQKKPIIPTISLLHFLLSLLAPPFGLLHRNIHLQTGQIILIKRMTFRSQIQMMYFMFIWQGLERACYFCLHGGGYSGLSFALAASKIKEKARIVAMDLRGHGKTCTQNDVDLSIETLCSDVFSVLKTMYGDAPPAIVLVGH
ncbi:hypothetical protein HAX54_006855, partial [Datura stramonium]|nr:hypothetical protein [Datura stramonium]